MIIVTPSSLKSSGFVTDLQYVDCLSECFQENLSFQNCMKNSLNLIWRILALTIRPPRQPCFQALSPLPENEVITAPPTSERASPNCKKNTSKIIK